MSQYTPRGQRWNALRLVILDRDGHQCVQCGSATELEVDHITPLASITDSEGRDRLAYAEENLRTLCKRCNGRKGDRALTRSTWFSRRWLSKV